MLKETILTVQTCDLKVDFNCNGCAKEIKKILHRINGVYQTNVDRKQGKVTVTGLMDMDTVFKKLKKAGMSAQLWDANSAEVSKHQKLQLGDNDMGDQLNGAGGKSLPQVEANSSGGCNTRSGNGMNDATMVLPQSIPTPQQHVPNIQQQIEQRLQMLKGEKLPPHFMGIPPAINSGDGNQTGKKIGGGTKIQVPGNANNDNRNVGQPLHNGALGSLNNQNQAKKDNTIGVGSQMMSGSMKPQNGGMMRPTNNIIGPTSLPVNKGQMGSMLMGPYSHLDDYNNKPYGGGATHGLGMPASGLPRNGFYPSSSGSSGMEIMQQVASNPMLQQAYMMVQPKQEHKMWMNEHWPHNQNARPGYDGYQLMGYNNGHEHLQQQYPPPMYYPMPLPSQHDTIFGDENPNICSLM